MNYLIIGIEMFIFGIIPLYCAISNFIEKKNCTYEISGKFTEIFLDTISRPNSIDRYYCFEYKYKGRIYHRRALDKFTNKMDKTISIGTIMPIWINENKPTDIKCRKKSIYLIDVYMFLFGSFLTDIDLRYKENYPKAYSYLEEYAKEDNAKYYDIVEDSYEFDYGLMLIVYEDEEHEYEDYHICINVLGNEIENGGTWR